MGLARKIEASLTRSSWIRKMFEEGARLKAGYGADNVFDFSLGNPNLPPPPAFQSVLEDKAAQQDEQLHGYMPNAGYPFVRRAVAGQLAREFDCGISENEILLTCGAAGALNVILKAILDPGDEVLTPAPYFVEYNFYVDNHGGSLKTVATKADFSLDLAALDSALTERTRAVLINSPNNPTGQIYSRESLEALGEALRTRSRQNGRSIYLISDEPYRKIVYDGAEVPSIFDCYDDSIVAYSYSKELSLAGERIGFIAVNPVSSQAARLMEGMTLTNRILGFVNAPALMQRVVAELQGVCVDVEAYARKRRLICEGLAACGYEFVRPPGAFYLFPRSPIADDVKFVAALQEERILVVPGSGFGGPGHFRIAFCVADRTIQRALPGFASALARFK